MQRIDSARYMVAMQIFNKLHASECMIVATAAEPLEVVKVFLPFTQDAVIARLVVKACVRWYQEHVA